MSQVNLNKQTPKPDVLPPSQVYVQPPPRRLPPPAERPATGKTTRLSRHCKKCGDEFPASAQFCIACGAPR